MKTRTAAVRVVGQARVVGLDISLNRPGICILSGDPRTRVDAGLIVDSAMIRSGEELRGPERLSVVTAAIWSWLRARRISGPGVLYVQEGYAFSRSHAHSMGEIGGCIRRDIWASGGNLIVVPPSTLKKFVTKSGAADKNVMMKELYKRWGYDVDDDNQCDAFSCALVGLVDQCDAGRRTAAENDMLQNKVERYAGEGQDWYRTEPKSRGKAAAAKKRRDKA